MKNFNVNYVKAAFVLISFAILFIGWSMIFSVNTFTVDSKHWQCTATRPVGIGAECTVLEMKLGGLR